MPGLDPGIHSVAVAASFCGYGMDCRIKSGNDDKGWLLPRLASMFLIRCPYCGERDISDFAYGGEAHIARPVSSEAMSDAEWAGYVFLRTNPKGIFAERWNHQAGCRRWFNAIRNTATDEFLAVYRIGERRSDVTADLPPTPSGEASIGSGNDAAKVMSPGEGSSSAT
jgi:heterotetrameric sarcosine oxidase delta subunit